MATLKYGNTIIENVAMVKIDDTVNKDIIVEYVGEGFHNSFKIENIQDLKVGAKGIINNMSVSCITVFGNVQHISSGASIKVQGLIRRFDNQQRNIKIDKSVKVTAKNTKNNKLEIIGNLEHLDVSISFCYRNKIYVEVHGNCGCILATDKCEIKGNVDNACAIYGITYSMQ